MSDEQQDQTDQREADDQDQHDTDTQDATLGDSGKAAIRAEREARKKAEADAKALQARLEAIEADARKKQDAEAVEQGKWQELAEKREADLTDATTRLNATTATLETLEAYVKADIAAVSKAVKAAAKDNDVAAVLQDIHPGDDADVSDLIAWLGKAKPRMAAITEKPRTPGNGPNPPASDGTRDLKAAEAEARANPKYSF